MGGAEEASGLPDFERPPVIEVAVGVEFVPLPGLDVVRLVRLHELWRDRLPKLQTQPPLPPGQPPGGVLEGFGLQITTGAGPLRLWMLSEDEHLLVQVQHDRLFVNWRRLDGQMAYPRYAVLRAEFLERWTQFLGYVSDLGPIRPAIADVTFVNSIESAEGRADLSAVLSTAASADGLPGRLVSSRAQYIVDVGPRADRPAHMVVTAAPEGANDQRVSLHVVTRVALSNESMDPEAMMAALDHAHNVGVNGFTAFTRSSMHEMWGRSA